jgi:hypothetical protein
MGRIPKCVIGYFFQSVPSTDDQTIDLLKANFYTAKFSALKLDYIQDFFFTKFPNVLLMFQVAATAALQPCKWKVPGSNTCPPTGCQVG